MRRIAGLCACVAAALVIAGAYAPWFGVSFLGLTAHIGGMSGSLHGGRVLALGIAALALGILAVALPLRMHIGRVLAVALAGIGVAGAAVMWQQAAALTPHSSQVTHFLQPLADLVGAHASASWGFWLEIASFVGLALLAVAVWLTAGGSAYSSRSAPPSTGMTQPVRYDAAGESRKAATRPNSSGAP